MTTIATVTHVTDTAGTLRAALEKHTSELARRNATRWSFVLSNGCSFPGWAQLQDGWLLMGAEIPAKRLAPRSGDGRLWRAMEGNEALSGGAKFVLEPGRGLALSAERPVDGAAELAARVAAACGGFRRAIERSSHTTDPESQQLDLPSQPGGDPAPAVEPMLRELGWSYSRSEGGRVSVDLEVPGCARRAEVESDTRSTRVLLELGTWEDGALGIIGRRGLAVFLLSATRAVRMVSAGARSVPGGETVVRFGVDLGPRFTAAELAHALSALSVAWGLGGREVQAVSEERVARDYLAIQGWPCSREQAAVAER